MKTITQFLIIMAFGFFSTSEYSNNDNHYLKNNDMKLLLNYLDRTEREFLMTLDTMNIEIRNFKPNDNAWSVKEIVAHVVTANQGILSQVKIAMENNSQTVEDLSKNDAWLISKVSDRGVKVTTPLPAPDDSIAWETLTKSYKDNKQEITNFLANPNLELRKHYGRSPYGKADCYQMFLVLAAHNMRHHHQILDNINSYYE